MAARRKKSGSGPELFIEQSGQLRMTDKSAEQRALEKRRVECLGMVFESDEARRAYFLEKLRERLKDPEFRKIEGFPRAGPNRSKSLTQPPVWWYAMIRMARARSGGDPGGGWGGSAGRRWDRWPRRRASARAAPALRVFRALAGVRTPGCVPGPQAGKDTKKATPPRVSRKMRGLGAREGSVHLSVARDRGSARTAIAVLGRVLYPGFGEAAGAGRSGEGLPKGNLEGVTEARARAPLLGDVRVGGRDRSRGSTARGDHPKAFVGRGRERP